MDRTQRIADRYCARAAQIYDGNIAALIERARRNLALMRAQRSAADAVLAPWEALLDDPDAFQRTLTTDTERAAELRRNNPLAGALPDPERRDIVREAWAEVTGAQSGAASYGGWKAA
ncbi:MAG: hypothetical protein U5L06_03525 [Rhodovibrio sp.]|nr:hypothetical protein [Rhodovibrio sp.]